MLIICITIDVEKELIDKLFENATKVLTDDDRKLPAVINIVPLIRRGIGIHHGGRYHMVIFKIQIKINFCFNNYRSFTYLERNY